jgi:CRP-like cAMP-binding protein
MATGDTAALFAALGRLAPVSDAALRALAAIMAPRSFARGALLLRGGEVATRGFFVGRGLVREYYVGDGGEEHTRSFIAEGGITGSLLDLQSGEPSITWIQALEPTRTLGFGYRDFDALCARFPELHVVARRWAEALYRQKTRREHEMLALGAAERYARWRAQSAELDARISRRQLASYLGMTPEHLSRLSRAGRARPAPARAR